MIPHTKPIDTVVVHHTGGPRSQSFEAIRRYHIDDRGYGDIGYHRFIDGHGVVHAGRPFEFQGAHSFGHNDGSIGIAVAGNNTDGRMKWNEAQLTSLEAELKTLKFFGVKYIKKHSDQRETLCPSFDLCSFLEERGI